MLCATKMKCSHSPSAMASSVQLAQSIKEGREWSARTQGQKMKGVDRRDVIAEEPGPPRALQSLQVAWQAIVEHHHPLRLLCDAEWLSENNPRKQVALTREARRNVERVCHERMLESRDKLKLCFMREYLARHRGHAKRFLCCSARDSAVFAAREKQTQLDELMDKGIAEFVECHQEDGLGECEWIHGVRTEQNGAAAKSLLVQAQSEDLGARRVCVSLAALSVFVEGEVHEVEDQLEQLQWIDDRMLCEYAPDVGGGEVDKLGKAEVLLRYVSEKLSATRLCDEEQVHALTRSLYRRGEEKEENINTKLVDFNTDLAKDKTPLKKDDSELGKGDTCKDHRSHDKEKTQTKWQTTVGQIFTFVLRLCYIYRSLCLIFLEISFVLNQQQPKQRRLAVLLRARYDPRAMID